MDKLQPLLMLGLVDLSFSYAYFLFTNQQYFSIVAMAFILILALLSAVLFVVPFYYRKNGKMLKRLLLASLIISIPIIAYEHFFSNISFNATSAAIAGIAVASIAALISLLGIIAAGHALRSSNMRRYAVTLIAIIVSASFSFFVMKGLASAKWNAVDEVAYNYYAASLFVNGSNPYAVSMQPILAARGISPTVLLNGTYEYSYDYPALSFLAFTPIPLLGIRALFIFVFVLVLISTVSGFLVYYNAGFNRNVLPPILLWLSISFALIGEVNGVSIHYLAIALFLLLAYVFRRRHLLSGVFLGLAASTIQIAWLAIPFFYALALRSYGSKAFYQTLVATISVFFAINGYFMVSSPSFMTNVFGLLLFNQAAPFGPNIMQFLMVFYPVTLWYPAFVSAIALLSLLCLFYAYTRSLLPLISVAPSAVLFLTWHNIAFYTLPYFPLLLAVCYDEKAAVKAGLLRDKKPLLYVSLGIILIAMIACVYSHGIYVHSENRIAINNVEPIIRVTYGANGYQFGLEGFNLNFTYYGGGNGTVSFYLVGRNPTFTGYVLGSAVHSFEPGVAYDYNLGYTIPYINNSTKLMLFLFDKNYIVSREINLELNPPPQLR